MQTSKDVARQIGAPRDAPGSGAEHEQGVIRQERSGVRDEGLAGHDGAWASPSVPGRRALRRLPANSRKVTEVSGRRLSLDHDRAFLA